MENLHKRIIYSSDSRRATVTLVFYIFRECAINSVLLIALSLGNVTPTNNTVTQIIPSLSFEKWSTNRWDLRGLGEIY